MQYSLYNLEIETIGDLDTFNCSHKPGDTIVIKGENLEFKKGTKHFSHYVLASLMPYIAAKQRAEQESDWMSYETDIACPDPKCGAIFRFKRQAKTKHEY